MQFVTYFVARVRYLRGYRRRFFWSFRSETLACAKWHHACFDRRQLRYSASCGKTTNPPHAPEASTLPACLVRLLERLQNADCRLQIAEKRAIGLIGSGISNQSEVCNLQSP